MKLSDFKVLTFDCYGTLIDWESGMVNALAPLTDQLAGKLTRNDILEAHVRHESSQQLQTPYKRYRELLAIVYRRLAEGIGGYKPTDRNFEYMLSLLLSTIMVPWLATCFRQNCMCLGCGRCSFLVRA